MGFGGAISANITVDAGRRAILVVDDDRHLRKIISTNLELAGYHVIAVPSGREALELLDVAAIDLAVLDVNMPEMDGYEVCRRIRRHSSSAHIPIIMLTARGGTDDVVEGFDAGADDFITKPFGPEELLARVRAKIRRVAVDASLQPLTRLPGNVAIETEIRRRFDFDERWAVLYLDLDNFKAFNDVYGFMQGDEAIQLLATVVTDSVRRLGDEYDFVGHIGGDDFIVATLPERAEPIANEIIKGFDAGITGLYTADDAARGHIETHDRRGHLIRFPIMSVSIAIVTNEERRLSNYREIGELAAELKQYAKSLSGSVLVKNKRRS